MGVPSCVVRMYVRRVLGEAGVRVLTGMRQKSATQFGGVPRLSRLVELEAMVLSYVFL